MVTLTAGKASTAGIKGCRKCRKECRKLFLMPQPQKDQVFQGLQVKFSPGVACRKCRKHI